MSWVLFTWKISNIPIPITTLQHLIYFRSPIGNTQSNGNMKDLLTNNQQTATRSSRKTNNEPPHSGSQCGLLTMLHSTCQPQMIMMRRCGRREGVGKGNRHIICAKTSIRWWCCWPNEHDNNDAIR